MLDALTSAAQRWRAELRRQRHVLGEGDLEVERACSGTAATGEVGVRRHAGGGVGALEAVVARRRGRRASRSAARKAWGVWTAPAAPVDAASGRAWRSPVDGDHRDRAADRRGAASTTARHSAAPASGRAPSWTTTTSTSPDATSSASTCSAAHSEACRVAPPSTTSTSRSPRWGATASLDGGPVLGAHDEHEAAYVGQRERVAHRPDQHGHAAQRQQHLVDLGADPGARAGRQDHDGRRGLGSHRPA